MMSSRRIQEVAKQQAALTDERYSGYLVDLVACLLKAIASQSEGLSDKGRQDQVNKIVESLGSKVAAGTGSEGK
jgi:hypothetical protein